MGSENEPRAIRSAAAWHPVSIETSLNVTGPSDYRIPRMVTLGVDGLFGDRAALADNPLTPFGGIDR